MTFPFPFFLAQAAPGVSSTIGLAEAGVAALAQLTSEGAQGWERVGLIGFLVTALVLLGTALILGDRVFFGVVPGYRYKAKEDECAALRAEVKQLWQEKIEDAKRAADVAEAYVEIRRRDA